MKGTSGTLGLTAVHTACLAAEKHLAAEPIAAFDTLAGPLTSALKIVLDGLKNSPVKAVDKTGKTIGEIRPIVLNLKRLLKDGDPEASNLILEIATIEEYDPQLERLTKLVKSYDYESALEVLAEINLETIS